MIRQKINPTYPRFSNINFTCHYSISSSRFLAPRIEKNSQLQLVATQFKHPRLIYPLLEYPLPIINSPLPRREPRINQS